MKRFLACLMSLVLAVGLMPTAAFGSLQPTALSSQGVDSVYDVSNGRYAPYDTVRRLYTRPVTLRTSPDSGQKLYRTVELDLSNPIYDGADLAIRYTGDSPFFVRSDSKWNNWVWMGEGSDGVWAESANDGTGQKVIFFSRDAFEKRYEKTGAQSAHLYVAVHAESTSYPDRHEECNLVEVVALGGAERVDPKSGSYHEITGLTRDQIARDMRAGYNMAGHFDCNWVDRDKNGSPILKKDGGWSYSDLMLEANGTNVYITRETIHALKQKGFNAVRLPATWFQHIYPEGDPTGNSLDHLNDMTPVQRYHIDRAWMERVHEVVDWCIAEDMYVILNIHHEDWIDRSDLATAYDDPSTDLPAKFKAVWTQIANEFAGYDQHLVFEDMNEPHAVVNGIDPVTKKYKRLSWGYATEGSVATVNNLNRDFVKLMRDELEGHRERLLMMAHDTGNGEIATTGFVMPDDAEDLLAVSMHCYAPHGWTHYFMDDDEGKKKGELNVYTDSYRHSAETAWAGYRSHYTSQGYTVILGEFGCYYCGEERQQDRLDWMTQYATHAKELGIPMFYWRMDRSETGQDGNKHIVWSAFDEEEHDFSDLSREMMQRWFDILDDDGIEWGEYARVDDGERADIDEGVQLLADSGNWPQDIEGVHRTGTTGWRVVCSNREDAGASSGKSRLEWSDIAGKDIAVKFEGSAPRLGCANEDWGNDSWGDSPDYVDYVNGIAYFESSSIATRWKAVVASSPDPRVKGNTEEDVTRIFIPTATVGDGAPLDDAVFTKVLQVAIVHHHEWSRWEKTTPPTCTAAGEKTRTCASDADHVLSRPIPALGHEWGSDYVVDVEATSEHAGSKSIHCTRCGEIKPGSAVVIAKLVATEEGAPNLKSKLVAPKATSLTKLKAAKRGFTAKWKKAAGASGYQLPYGLKKSFKGAKKVAVAKAKTTSKKVAKLKAKKKYWVRVRAYAKADGKTAYSAWSKAKSVKTK